MRASLNANHRLGKSLPQKIVIIRSLPGLGDMLCFIPAIRALHEALPEAQITLIGLSKVAHVVERFRHYLNDWLEFPGYPGIPEVPLSPKKTILFLNQVQQLNFDLALQMHGNGSCINSFAFLLGAKLTAGFYPSGQPCPDQHHFLPYPDQEPEVWRHLKLMQFLGVPLQGEHLEFPIFQSDWQAFEELASVYHLRQDKYICIHPGASTIDKCWAPQKFAKVADVLATQGFQIVLTGSESEVQLTESVAQTMQFPTINLAGKTNLGTIAALLKRSRLLICNDTGISHLAAALQVGSVVIFSNSDPQRWAPLDPQRHQVVVSKALASCLDQVLVAATTVLDREVAYAS